MALCETVGGGVGGQRLGAPILGGNEKKKFTQEYNAPIFLGISLTETHNGGGVTKFLKSLGEADNVGAS